MTTAVARRTAPPGGQALAAWSIFRDGDEIVAGGVRLHRVVARDLAVRIDDLLEEGDRHARRDAWVGLEEHLDAHFAFALGAVGKQIARGGAHVPGRVFRASPTRAVMRIATFALVRLRPVRRQRRGLPWTPWEGAVRELRPLTTGWDEQLTDLQVRVEAAVVEASPLAIPGVGRPGPSTAMRIPTSTQVTRAPLVAPQLPAAIAARRWEVAVGRSVLLSALEHGAATAAELARAVAAPPATVRVLLRGMLDDQLVERRGPRWLLSGRGHR